MNHGVVGDFFKYVWTSNQWVFNLGRMGYQPTTSIYHLPPPRQEQAISDT
jgi:hypothetical protein